MRIAEIHLHTQCLHGQKVFYHQLFGLPLLAESPTSFTVMAGASTITFVATAEPLPASYHVAFNIPENQLAAAKQWLAERVPLQQNGDSDEWFFPDWNAHAVYYLDAAGNILEFIARHNLPTATQQPFAWQSILAVSEIGLATPDVRGFCQQLNARLGLERWRGNDIDFAAVGDEEGLFIVTVNGRIGLAGKWPAQPLPTTVVVRGTKEQTVTFAGLPYQVIVQATHLVG